LEFQRAKVLLKFLRTRKATLLLPVGYPYMQRKSFVKKVNKENADKIYYRQLNVLNYAPWIRNVAMAKRVPKSSSFYK
jgi:hypothetical protein